MSTKAIREALDELGKIGLIAGSVRLSDVHNAARVELEAIEKAAKVLSFVDTGKVPRTEANMNQAFDVMTAIANQER